MSATPRGTWVVVIREIAGNEDELLGPFRSEEKAEAVAQRLRGDVEARAASHVIEAVVKWVRPGIETEEARDEMLVDLDAMGYEYRPPVPGGAFGSGRRDS